MVPFEVLFLCELSESTLDNREIIFSNWDNKFVPVKFPRFSRQKFYSALANLVRVISFVFFVFGVMAIQVGYESVQ